MNGWIYAGCALGLAVGYLLVFALCRVSALADMMVCGHSKDSIVSTSEGTHYCIECEYEARNDMVK